MWYSKLVVELIFDVNVYGSIPIENLWVLREIYARRHDPVINKNIPKEKKNLFYFVHIWIDFHKNRIRIYF